MIDATTDTTPVIGAARRLINRLLAIGENRFQILAIEVQEERNRLVDMVFLAVATAALGLLAGITFTAAVVLLFWRNSPVETLCILGGAYVFVGLFLCRRLLTLRNHPPTFRATLEELRKDRECLTKN